MNFVTVEGRTLARALRPLLDTVLRGSSIPILRCVKLTLTTEGLWLEATDLDCVVTTMIDVIDGDRAGGWGLCLPAASLAGIAKVAGAMPLRIEPGAKATLTLGDGEAVYTLDTLPAQDFPDLLAEPGDLLERFGNGRLTAHLDKVAAFVSTEETRYYLNGVAWQRGAFGSRLVATDGHRLALCGYDGEARAEAESRIIPLKAILLLTRHFDGRDISVHAAHNGAARLVFVSDRLTLATKLIDGTFPDVDRVIPKAGAFSISLVRSEIQAGIARLVALGLREGNKVKLAPVEGRLTLERSCDGGQAKVTLSSAWPEAGPEGGLPEFGLNAFYFGDMVHGCEGDITLAVSSLGDPLLIRDADPAMTRVLMPMRV